MQITCKKCHRTFNIKENQIKMYEARKNMASTLRIDSLSHFGDYSSESMVKQYADHTMADMLENSMEDPYICPYCGCNTRKSESYDDSVDMCLLITAIIVGIIFIIIGTIGAFPNIKYCLVEKSKINDGDVAAFGLMGSFICIFIIKFVLLCYIKDETISKVVSIIVNIGIMLIIIYINTVTGSNNITSKVLIGILLIGSYMSIKKILSPQQELESEPTQKTTTANEKKTSKKKVKNS